MILTRLRGHQILVGGGIRDAEIKTPFTQQSSGANGGSGPVRAHPGTHLPRELSRQRSRSVTELSKRAGPSAAAMMG